MTLEETAELLTPYALGLRVQMDVPTFRAYHLMLKDVPATLVAAGLEQLAKSGLRFMPAAPEIRTAAEKSRRQLLALNPWSACAECETQPGWRSITDARGDSRLEKCPCKKRHQERLGTMGILEPIAALAGEVERESEQVYPTVEQLPAPLRKQIAESVSRKVLR